MIVLKLYISDAGNEAILEGVKITTDTEDLIFDFETSDDAKGRVFVKVNYCTVMHFQQF